MRGDERCGSRSVGGPALLLGLLLLLSGPAGSAESGDPDAASPSASAPSESSAQPRKDDERPREQPRPGSASVRRKKAFEPSEEIPADVPSDFPTDI